MKCRGPSPCRHVLGTLRSRSRKRVKVLSAEARAELWYLELECGHRTTRIVQHVVYAPYPALPAPRHIYCVECPVLDRQALADWDRRFDAWSRSHAS